VPFLAALTIQLHLPDNGSLKGKRKELLSVRAALVRRYGASVAEVDDHDLWQRATLAAGVVSRTAGELEHTRASRSEALSGESIHPPRRSSRKTAGR